MTDDPFEGLAFDGGSLPPVPGLEQQLVHRVRRRRRVRQALAGSGAAAVVAGVVLAGSLLGGGSKAAVLVPGTDTPSPAAPSPSAPEVTATEPETNPTEPATPTSDPGQPLPAGAVASNASWISPDEGFAVMSSDCRSTFDCSVSLAATTDSGRTWHRQGQLPDDHRRHGDEILFLDAQRGWDFVSYTVGSTKVRELFATTDGGRTWREIPLPAFFIAMHVTSDGLLVEMGDPGVNSTKGGIYRMPFDGTELVRTLEDEQVPNLAVWGDDVWVSSSDLNATSVHLIRRSRDGGRTWATVDDPCPSGRAAGKVGVRDQVVDIQCNGSGGDEVVLSVDSGTTFNRIGPAPCDFHAPPRIVSATSLLCTQREGERYLSTDSGAHWTKVIPAQVYDPHAGASASVESSSVLHDFHGNVCQRSDDGGRTWTSYPMD